MRTRGLSHPAWHTHLPRRLRQHHGVARRPRRDTTDARRPRCQPPVEHGAVELWGNTIYARRPRRDTTDARRPRCQPPLAQCGSGRRSQHSGGRWSGQIIRSASTALSTLNRRWLSLHSTLTVQSGSGHYIQVSGGRWPHVRSSATCYDSTAHCNDGGRAACIGNSPARRPRALGASLTVRIQRH